MPGGSCLLICFAVYLMAVIFKKINKVKMKSLNIIPPSGAWIKQEKGQIRIGADTKVKNVIYYSIPLLALWLFVIGYYGLWLETIQNEYYKEAPIVALFLILFFIGGLLFLLYQYYMGSYGRIEFVVKKGVVTLFRGFGSIGFTKVFLLKDIQYIHKHLPASGTDYSSTYYKVALKHKKTFSFGHRLSDEKGDFVYNTLLKLKKNGL